MSDQPTTVNVDAKAGSTVEVPNATRVSVSGDAKLGFMQGWFGVFMQAGFAGLCGMMLVWMVMIQIPSIREDRAADIATFGEALEKMQERHDKQLAAANAENQKLRDRVFSHLGEIKLNIKIIMMALGLFKEKGL